MNDSKISVRYSKALFDSAVERNVLDKVFLDMELISELCRMPEIKEVLISPVILPSKKKNILFAILEKNIQPVTLSLVALLIKNGREDHLPAVARVFRDETLQHKGITESTLTTAVPVSEKIRKEIISMVESVFKTKVELKETVDPEIIGGFVLKIDDNFIDASVRNKLRRISKGFSARTFSKEY